MNDPWKVLGVNRGASKDEIRSAYLSLVKKYHPDRFQDPAAKEIATERLKAINLAYDQLNSDKPGSQAGANQGYTGQSYTQYGDDTASDQAFMRIRILLNNRQIEHAETLLDAMRIRPAQWYYLRGVCYSMRGWYAMAREHLERAVQLDPANQEYRHALNQFTNSTQYYRRNAANYMGLGRMRSGGSVSACNICSCLLCSDCCCECLGGDLIPCC